jgi:hypothetical protein
VRGSAARHAVALGLTAAWLLVPEGAWQEARLRLLARLEGAAPAAGSAGQATTAHAGRGSGDRRCDRCLAYEAAAAEAALGRDRALAALAQAVALAEASPAIRPEERIPAGVRGGAAAARLALASPLARGFHVRLDQGSERGIRPGQAVLVGAALVGRVSATGEGVAEVVLLPAPRFHVRALAVRVGGGAAASGGLDLAPGAPPIPGIASGDGARGLVFRPAEPGAPVLPGDRIVVDFGGGFAPEGALVGVVTRVREQGASRLVEAHVAPAAGLDALDRVIVVARAGLLDEGPAPESPPSITGGRASPLPLAVGAHATPGVAEAGR